jgi:hypothetical protein
MTTLQIIGLLMPAVAVVYALAMARAVRLLDPHRKQKASPPKSAPR